MAVLRALGTTTFPKVVLSYRWIIPEADVLLAKRRDFTSPNFSALNPKVKLTCMWSLYLDKYSSTITLRHNRCDHGDHEVFISESTLSLVNPETGGGAKHSITATAKKCICTSRSYMD